MRHTDVRQGTIPKTIEIPPARDFHPRKESLSGVACVAPIGHLILTYCCTAIPVSPSAHPTLRQFVLPMRHVRLSPILVRPCTGSHHLHRRHPLLPWQLSLHRLATQGMTFPVLYLSSALRLAQTPKQPMTCIALLLESPGTHAKPASHHTTQRQRKTPNKKPHPPLHR